MLVRDWTMEDVATLIEIRGVYDGWSIARLKDGRYMNRWDDGTGNAIEGYEGRWKATEDYLSRSRVKR